MRKALSTLLLSTFLIGSCFTAVHADTGQNVSLSYHNYSVPGQVDGSKNGMYYTLTTGGVTLQVTSTTSSKGSMGVTLMREKFGIDENCGNHFIEGTGNYSYSVSTNSSKYYIIAGGGAAGTDASLEGRLHDHK